jgi:hypothetical protein
MHREQLASRPMAVKFKQLSFKSGGLPLRRFMPDVSTAKMKNAPTSPEFFVVATGKFKSRHSGGRR